MLKTLALHCASKEIHAVTDPEQISELCATGQHIIWVDVADPTSADFDELAKEFGFHPLAIEDCRVAHQRPKVEEFPGYYFIVLYEGELTDNHELELRELNIFLGKNYLVTVHSQPIRALLDGERSWRNWADIADRSAGVLVYLLIDQVVDGYMTMLDQLSDRIDEIEEAIFSELRGEMHPAGLQEIFRIKKQLLYLRRTVTPLRDVFNKLLRRDLAIFSRETLFYFQDVFDNLIRVAEMIDTLRDTLTSTVEAYLSVSGFRMNLIMKRLTSISTILMSVTLIAGIYGMNFKFMPELDARYGYVGALLMMWLVGVGLYLYFRKIEWL